VPLELHRHPLFDLSSTNSSVFFTAFFCPAHVAFTVALFSPHFQDEEALFVQLTATV
jgi:hypothetical protein